MSADRVPVEHVYTRTTDPISYGPDKLTGTPREPGDIGWIHDDLLNGADPSYLLRAEGLIRVSTSPLAELWRERPDLPTDWPQQLAIEFIRYV